MSPAVIGYTWCALAGLASALATYLLKLSGHHGDGASMARLALMGGAGATYAIGFVFYSFALQRLDMSLAYPVMTGAAMAIVAAIGLAVLGEPLGPWKLAGMLLIALGVFALSR